MHMRAEESCVFFSEDEYFAAFTIHLQEIDVRYRVFMNKILEGYSLDFNGFPIRIILLGNSRGLRQFSHHQFFHYRCLFGGVFFRFYLQWRIG